MQHVVFSIRHLAFTGLLALASITSTAFADWQILPSGTSNTLNAVDFPVDANTGYTVGHDGTILKTSDAGSSWKKLKSKSKARLLDVQFPVDNQTGFVVGSAGTLLKTTDAGASWQLMNTGTTVNLYAVEFPTGTQVGYIAGDSHSMLKTLDGGQTWTPLVIDFRLGSIRDIDFPRDDQTGYITGNYGAGAVYKTIDGGQNWVYTLAVYDATIGAIDFPTGGTGYASYQDDVFGSSIWKTIDSGANWLQVMTGRTNIPVDMHFPLSPNQGVAVGYRGAIFKTASGGDSWLEGRINIHNALLDVHFLDNQQGYAVGGGGLIARTLDGGAPPARAMYLHPTGAGSVNNFATMAGCSTAWDCVNDQDANLGTGVPASLNSRDYLSDRSGNRAMFALDDNTVPAGGRIIDLCVSLATSQSTGTYTILSYQRMGIDPAPVDSKTIWSGGYWISGMARQCWYDLDWSASDLDKLEIGMTSVASIYPIEVSQVHAKVHYIPAP